ncbi:acyltransferase family protein [Kineothrix alysoides]|nr:acyltransferase family protein [Kineothrix alysoides]
MAIIGVVVCHQIAFLHHSDWINFLTIYSVPMLILCMGITKAFSIERYINKTGGRELFSYTFKSMQPALLSYVVCCMVCGVYYQKWNGWSFIELGQLIFKFDVVGPFYFMEYYIILSILSPYLFLLWKMAEKPADKRFRYTLQVCFLFTCFFIGFVTRNNFTLLGSSYLVIYALGIQIGRKYEKLIEWIANGKKIIFFVFFWGIGIYMAKTTFWCGGDFSRTIGIDKYLSPWTLNPPNISVILYMLSSFLLFAFIFKKLQGKIAVNLFVILGKYSLDIYLWHIVIQNIFVVYVWKYVPNMWLMRFTAYSMMFAIPVIGRYIWDKFKSTASKYIIGEKQALQ